MSGSANADDFGHALRRIDEDYRTLFKAQLDRLSEQLAGKELPHSNALIDESREIHARTYIVNAWLEALNWRMTATPSEGLPNLVPESAVKSLASDTRRFMDYLGIEGQSLRPLLLVETKRAQITLPTLISKAKADSYEEIIARGLKGEGLSGDWNHWLLNDVGDYVRSVHSQTGEVPARVLITNGEWLVLFLDPEDAFLPNGSKDRNHIVVCLDRATIQDSAGVLFERLEHSRVLKGIRALKVPELLFYVDPIRVDAVMHGLHVLYDEEPRIHKPTVPRIIVAPVVFLRSTFGSWFYVEGSTEYDLPHDSVALPAHLSDVQTAAEQLLSAVAVQLSKVLTPRRIDKHYADTKAFSVVRGVAERGRSGNQFLLVTGSNTHYLRPSSSVPDCSFHDYAAANAAGCAGELVMIRRTQPRAFFVSKETHHCAHAHVKVAKSSPVSPDNETRCGPRSRGRGSAFCEIWKFETHLCCRTCAYEEVCTGAQVFQLPCSRP